MSAYIVSDKTITAIVTAMQRKEFSTGLVNPKTMEEYNPRSNPQMVGQILLDQNYASINYRYDENKPSHRFTMDFKTNERGYREDFTLGEMYGSVRSYMYQACETPDWVGSDIYFAMCGLKDDLAEKMLDKLGEEMTWGI